MIWNGIGLGEAYRAAGAAQIYAIERSDGSGRGEGVIMVPFTGPLV